MLGKLLRQLLGRAANKASAAPRIEDAYEELTREHYERARDMAHEILAATPRSIAARLLLAQASGSLGDMRTASAEVEHAIGLDPSNPDGYLVRGMIHEAGAHTRAAIEDYDRALALNPAQIAALDRKGSLHDSLGEFDASLACASRLVTLEPDKADNHHKLAITLRELGRLADSQAALRRAIELVPSHAAARAHLALVLIERGSFMEAEGLLEKLLAESPDHLEGRWSAAVLNLLHARYTPGWAYYEARESRRDPKLRIEGVPEWDGTPLTDGTLMINAEQGIGDQIMFASCLPDLLAETPNCVLSCAPPLRSLLQRSFPTIRVVEMRQSPPLTADELPVRIRAQVMMGSLLGRYRQQRDRFPKHAGFLSADPEAVAAWQSRLHTLDTNLKVGLSWTGGTAKTRRNLRSIPLKQLRPLLDVEGCSFVSLQYVDSTAEIGAMLTEHGHHILQFPEISSDYDQTAALVASLDLVITVCTAVAHLSGAQAKPVWIMAPAVPEWRYLLHGEEMPWYPSARLWRQSASGCWDEVIEQVASALERYARDPDAVLRQRSLIGT